MWTNAEYISNISDISIASDSACSFFRGQITPLNRCLLYAVHTNARRMFKHSRRVVNVHVNFVCMPLTRWINFPPLVFHFLLIVADCACGSILGCMKGNMISFFLHRKEKKPWDLIWIKKRENTRPLPVTHRKFLFVLIHITFLLGNRK